MEPIPLNAPLNPVNLPPNMGDRTAEEERAKKTLQHQRRIANLMPPIKPGEVRNPTGRPKIPPEKRKAALEKLQNALPYAAEMHAELIAAACRILHKNKPSEKFPDGREFSKGEVSIIATAERSAAEVFNRLMGKPESNVNVRTESGAEEFARAFRILISGNAPERIVNAESRLIPDMGGGGSQGNVVPPDPK